MLRHATASNLVAWVTIQRGPQYGEAPLLWATRGGLLDIVGLLLGHGADPSAQDEVSQAIKFRDLV